MTKISSNHAENLARVPVGKSFFVQGVELVDLRFLYGVARRAGMRITMRSVESDEVYMTKGVRVWREK